MPAYTRGKKRDQTRYVKANAVLYYGFRTKDLSTVTGVTAGDLTALGHLTTLPTNAVACFAANAPKPPRVTKRIAGATATSQGSVSTFCGFDALAAALSAGWNLSKDGRAVGLRNTGRTITAVVELTPGGVLYAFPMNQADFAQYAAELGLQSAATITTAAEVNRLVRGSTYPKPGRATKELDTGANVVTFYAPEQLGTLQSPTSGWRVNTMARTLAAPTAPVAP